MKKCIYFLLLSLLIASCSNDRKKRNTHEHAVDRSTEGQDTVSISANEQEGIKDITNFYGGECRHMIGKTLDAGRRYFEVEVSNSESIENTKSMIGLTASNMACMIYQNLQGEKGKYDEIRVRIILKDGQKVEQGYPVSSLALVIAKMRIVQMVVNLLKEKNYSKLETMLNNKSSIAEYSKSQLISEIKKADASLGNVEMFAPYGYAFYKSDNGKPILRISGVLKRDKQNNEFSVVLDPESNKDEILMINYKL